MSLDYDKYMESNKDLNLYYTGAAEEGKFDVPNSEYNKQVGGGAAEQIWVDRMNKRFGTNHTDVSQFTRAQFGEEHYQRFGKNEGRKIDGAEKARSDAKEKAQNQLKKPSQGQGGPSQFPIKGPSYRPGVGSVDNSFGVGGDLTQSIGKQGDMTTTIGDNNQFGAGTNIGNDYSVTIGNQNAGNGSNGSGGTGLDNMMSSAAYSALNNNQYHRSNAQLNGYGRSQGAIDEANKQLGVQDRVANLYNLTGMDQNYWREKSKAQQGFYLGDVYNYNTPNWTMPSAPTKPEDRTEDIAKRFNP